MAKSKYEYVKSFEQEDVLLPGCFIVVRIDGKGFTKFSDMHGFTKPNDMAALNLMNESAQAVMLEFPDIRIAFGESDEYSFVLHRNATLFDRRRSKLVSLLTSCFTSNYVRLWTGVMGADRPMRASPMFDGRAVLYPSEKALRDYLAWRQVDTHINNQYNTCFWALVQQGGRTPSQAQTELAGTDVKFKNSLLFDQFGINYNNLPDIFKKGSIVLREKRMVVVKHDAEGNPVERLRPQVVVLHCDIIRDEPFWTQHKDLIA